MIMFPVTTVTILKEVYPILESIIKSGKSKKVMALRASFIVRMGEGMSDTEIASEFNVKTNTVKKWRTRWRKAEIYLRVITVNGNTKKQKTEELADYVRTTLSRNQRPDKPIKTTSEQFFQIFELALESPSKSGRPFNDWKARDLADEVNKRGICERISAFEVERFLILKNIQNLCKKWN